VGRQPQPEAPLRSRNHSIRPSNRRSTTSGSFIPVPSNRAHGRASQINPGGASGMKAMIPTRIAILAITAPTEGSKNLETRSPDRSPRTRVPASWPTPPENHDHEGIDQGSSGRGPDRHFPHPGPGPRPRGPPPPDPSPKATRSTRSVGTPIAEAIRPGYRVTPPNKDLTESRSGRRRESSSRAGRSEKPGSATIRNRAGSATATLSAAR
jgi:hypothetical protein